MSLNVKLLNEDIDNLSFFWVSLFHWFALNKRVFSWRKTNSPFNILIAEILLQQTNARKVEDVYNKIIKSYPTPWEMLLAGNAQLVSIIKPIGLLYRAERLIKIAEQLCYKHNGLVPQGREQLLKLPGVGGYIADAVLCYAYKHPAIPIDTNVIRLFCRYFGLTYRKTRAKDDKELAGNIKSLFVFYSTNTANLAVLDFASAVCRARSYDCKCCILRNMCKGSQNQEG